MVKRNLRVFLLAATFVMSCALASDRALAEEEIHLPSDQRAKLDSFEGHSIDEADKIYAAKDYRSALASYDAFVNEFPKSTITSYALYRKARSLQLDTKRFEAIKQYQELLDYFPNDVYYAAPALYQIGKMQSENGDMDQAVQTWAKMADDKDYSKHPLAADAVNSLAAAMVKGNNWEKAVQYYKQVAVDFRATNNTAAMLAIQSTEPYYFRIKPDEPGLREFYVLVKGFDSPQNVPADKKTDRRYWEWVRYQVRNTTPPFPADKQAEHDKFYSYWASAMEGNFPDDDGYQLDIIDFKFMADHDLKKWGDRMDALYKANQKGENFNRTIDWMRRLAANNSPKTKIDEYFQLLDFPKMNNDQIIGFMWVAFDQIKDPKLAKSVYGKINIAKLTDEKKRELAFNLNGRDHALAVEVCSQFENKDLGLFTLLRVYHDVQDVKNGLPVANQAVSIPDYAKEAYWMKGDLLWWSSKWDEAGAAYRSSDQPPGSLVRVAECYLQAGKNDLAIATFREIENFFPAAAPNAALRIARIYRDQMANKDKAYHAYVAVSSKYKNSSEASTAIVEMQALGFGPKGPGTDDVRDKTNQ